MPSPRSKVILAAAGSGKTRDVLNQAKSDPNRKVLITTYTNENLAQIQHRLAGPSGLIPGHITVMTWFSFLVSQCARPYQRSVLGEPGYIAGFNFVGKRNMYTPKADAKRYFLDSNRDLYRDGVAELSCLAEENTGGLVTNRLADMFDHIYVDELQDLAGYDLNLLDLMFRGRTTITAVGDPRQHTFSTNTSMKNKRHLGSGLMAWVQERGDCCDLEILDRCYRSSQAICDFADGLFPDLPSTTSFNTEISGHDGVFQIKRADVLDYVARYQPTILRTNVLADTMELSARNIGVSKGSTYDRVLIFPTKPMRKYLRTGNPSDAGSLEHFYVAVTRARYSVAFVVD